MEELTEEEFEAAIERALAAMPPRFLRALENVQIVAEDESDPARPGFTGAGGLVEVLAGAGAPGTSSAPSTPGGAHVVRAPGGEILGLYHGCPLTERGSGYGCVGTPPDTITIYKRPHERCFSSKDEIERQVGRTVVHEVGHFFGMDERQVRAMGY